MSIFEPLKSILKRREPEKQKRPPEPRKTVGYKYKPRVKRVVEHHQRIVVYVCNICGYRTGSRREIRRHVREAHRDIYRQHKHAAKFDNDGSLKAEYVEAPRQNRFHLSELYRREVIR